MLERLRVIFKDLTTAATLVAGRLRRQDAQIQALSMTIAAIVDEDSNVEEGRVGEPKRGLQAVLLNAASNQAEIDRLSNLYETLASRVALLEMTRHAGEPPVGSSVANELPSTNLAVRTNQIVEPLMSQFETILATKKAGVIRGHFNQIVQEYARKVIERDMLLNARDEWFRERQNLRREGGLARDKGRDVGTNTFAFPINILNGRPLSVLVVDVGAQNLTSEEHIYTPMVNGGHARVVGFEPLKDEAHARSITDPSVLMLNHFIGDGSLGTFRVGQFTPTSSLLEPNDPFLSRFVALSEMCRTVSAETVMTTRLDDVPEVRDCDYLKIDVQGGELDVLRGAASLLEDVAVVHCEVEFAPIYKGQPLFADVDAFLRDRGFELIDMMKAGYAAYNDLPRPMTESRLMWADAVYYKSPDALSVRGPEKLMRAAYIAHVNYGMFDLAAHYLGHFDKITGLSTKSAYCETLTAVKPSLDATST